MARQTGKEAVGSRRKPATTPEARENQLISMAHDLAEEQIRNGTASSQVITHFLKAGSRREELERARIEGESVMIQAKIDALASQKRVEAMYDEALQAMRAYSGQSPPQDDDFDGE